MPECFVAKASDLKDGDRRIVVSGQREVGVFFKDGAYYAYSNYCVHPGGPACEGILINNVVDIIDADRTYEGQTFGDERAFRLPVARLRIRPQDRRVHRRPQAEAPQVRSGQARRRNLRRRSEEQDEGQRSWTWRATKSASSIPRSTPTPKHLEHASQQARQRNYQDFLIVDVDAHHYESESYNEVFSYIESPVIRCEAMDSMPRAGRSGILNSQVGYQNIGGRMHRGTRSAQH